MSVYRDPRQLHPVGRCSWCESHDLPCSPETHDNPLARYLAIMDQLPQLRPSDMVGTWGSDKAVGRAPVIGGTMRRPEYVPEHYKRAEQTARTGWRIAMFALGVIAAVLTALVMIAFFARTAPNVLSPAPCGEGCATPSTYGYPPTGGKNFGVGP